MCQLVFYPKYMIVEWFAWKGGHRIRNNTSTMGTCKSELIFNRVVVSRKADNDLWKKAKKEEVELDEDAVKDAQDKLDKCKRIQSLKDRIKDIRDEGKKVQ